MFVSALISIIAALLALSSSSAFLGGHKSLYVYKASIRKKPHVSSALYERKLIFQIFLVKGKNFKLMP